MIGFCLAAGAGRRLAPLTAAVPKPLLAPAGRPLIDLACDALAKAGAERVVVNLHHGAERLAAHLAGRPDVQAVREPELLGTGGGLAGARRLGLLGARPRGRSAGDRHFGAGDRHFGAGDRHFGAGDRHFGAGERDPTVVVTCADHVVDPADLAALAAALERSGAPVAMGVGMAHAPVRPTFRLEGERATADPDGAWTAAGAFALRASLLDTVEPGYATLLDALLEPCWRRGELLGVPFRGAWADAGTLGRFLAVSAGLLAGRWPYPLPPGRLERSTTGGPVFVADGARLEPGAVTGGPVALDTGSQVAAGAVVSRAVIGAGATVGAGARVTGSVLGPSAEAEPGTLVVAGLLPPARRGARPAAGRRIG